MLRGRRAVRLLLGVEASHHARLHRRHDGGTPGSTTVTIGSVMADGEGRARASVAGPAKHRTGTGWSGVARRFAISFASAEERVRGRPYDERI